MSSSDPIKYGVEWLKREIARQERRLEALKVLLALLEEREVPFVLDERVEEVTVGRKTVARILVGEDYVRLVFDEPMKVPQEIREYPAFQLHARIQPKPGEPGSPKSKSTARA
ncbi:MAG: hypothetical protein N3D79_06475 [Acidilobaceae archaeon]|nr:hypothetical protein [Acidilobaceae archaeon]